MGEGEEAMGGGGGEAILHVPLDVADLGHRETSPGFVDHDSLFAFE